MRFIRYIFATLCLGLLPLSGLAAEGGEGSHEGLPAYATTVFHLGPIQITNSMVVTIVVTALLVLFAQVVSRNVTPVPSKLQNFAEWLVESLYNFLGEILGPELIKKSFWFFGSLFIFILLTNWIGLVPGVGTIGWEVIEGGKTVGFEPWLRGGNADLNMTAAMSILFIVLWVVWALQANGLVGFLKHIFAPKGKNEGFMAVFMVILFLVVGVLETISIAFRPVSLSFRLYGNVFAGENMLEAMMTMNKYLSWILPLPFYFLELLVGLVQALVFTLLTAVFTLLICEHEHEEGHEGEGHAH